MEEEVNKNSPLPTGTLDKIRSRKFLIMSLCILAALFLWFLRAIENNYTTSIERPIQINGVPQSFEVDDPKSLTVRLQIEGPGYVILRHNLRIPRPPLQIEFVEINPITPRDSNEWIESVSMERFLNSFRTQIADLSLQSLLPDTLQIKFIPKQ